jgi:WNK lysine deficient protein kinase
MSKIIEKSPSERYIRFDELLGTGATKKVYKGYDTHKGIEIAWNIIDVSSVPESLRMQIITEIKILESCKDSSNYHIIKLYNNWFVKEREEVVLITEIYLSGTIQSFINRVKKIKIKTIKKWCKQILIALNFLHKNDIIHRDIKCSNIFVNGNTGNIYLGDFGLSKKIDEISSSIVGTPAFMAPEIYEEKYDKSIDIYAFGMCLLEMITNESPYNECENIPQIWKKVTNNIKPVSLESVKNQNAKDLIIKCINYEKKNRPDIKNILNHIFFKNEKDEDEYIIINEELTISESMIFSKQKSSFDELEENGIETDDSPKKNKIK